MSAGTARSPSGECGSVVIHAWRRGWSALAWYVKALLGEDAYEHYLKFHRTSGCDSVPMTEKEFWRDKMDREDRNPQGRCC